MKQLQIFTILSLFVVLSSCSRPDAIKGCWQGSPERITVAGAADAIATTTLDFVPTKQNSGIVSLSAVVEVSAPNNQLGFFYQAYETELTATASIDGRYVTDDDNVLISFDPMSFNVAINPDGVMLAENLISEMPQPMIDSITASAARKWQLAVSPAILEKFNSYRKIDDFKVHNNSLLSFQIGKTDYTFHKTAR